MGRMYVADMDHGGIHVIAPDRTELAVWEAGETLDGGLNLPYSVAVDDAGSLYVVGVGLDHNSDSNVQKLQTPSLP